MAPCTMVIWMLATVMVEIPADGGVEAPDAGTPVGQGVDAGSSSIPFPSTNTVTPMIGEGPVQILPAAPPSSTGPNVVEKVAKVVLGIPFTAAALGAFGVMVIFSLMLLTTKPSNYVDTSRMDDARMDDLWLGMQVTAVAASAVLGLLALALILFPFSSLASLWN